MDFADMDLSALKPQKKRTVPSALNASIPRTVDFKDYRYPENNIGGGKRLKLPPLLSPLPQDLLTTLGVDEVVEKGNGRSVSSSGSSAGVIRQVSDLADALKRSAAQYFSKENYESALLDFTQSLTLFILALRMQERSRSDSSSASDVSASRKRRGWQKVLNFGDKIIANFSKVLESVKAENARKFNKYSHIMGIIYFTCGFLRIHISDLLREQLRQAYKKEEESKMGVGIGALLKELDVNIDTARQCFLDGERRIGIFIIMQGYPETWNRTLRKLSAVNSNEIVLAHDLKGVDTGFTTGTNYCLPVSLHSWSLDNMVNFTGWFVHEWGKGMDGVVI